MQTFTKQVLVVEVKKSKNLDISHYLNANNIQLANLGPIFLFSEALLKASSGKHLKKSR